MTALTPEQIEDGKRLTLEDCPVGLFINSYGGLCLKTEYGNNEGRIDAYIVSSGEFFWGEPPQTIANQRKQLVTPVDEDALLTAARDAARYREALELIWPFFEGEHYYDHPDSVKVRAALAGEREG